MNNAGMGTKVFWSLHTLYTGRHEPQFFRVFMNDWKIYQKMYIKNPRLHFTDEGSLQEKIDSNMVGVMLFDELRRTCCAHSLGIISQGSATDRLKFTELNRRIDYRITSPHDGAAVHWQMSEACREIISQHYFRYPELTDLQIPIPRQLEWKGLFEGSLQVYAARFGMLLRLLQ
jgi:hypothetical protein